MLRRIVRVTLLTERTRMTALNAEVPAATPGFVVNRLVTVCVVSGSSRSRSLMTWARFALPRASAEVKSTLSGTSARND